MGQGKILAEPKALRLKSQKSEESTRTKKPNRTSEFGIITRECRHFSL